MSLRVKKIKLDLQARELVTRAFSSDVSKDGLTLVDTARFCPAIPGFD
jgi:hypothetical protein